MNDMDLNEQISLVRALRKTVATQADMISEGRKQWDNDNRVILASVEADRARLREEEKKLRAATLEAYQETGNKKPAPGVGIRVVKEMFYDDDEAIQWAIRANALPCLSLQKANFKKVAEGLKLGFVDIREIPQATISKEL